MSARASNPVRCRVKRAILVMSVSVVLGLLTTVAIAWSCSLLSELSTASTLISSTEHVDNTLWRTSGVRYGFGHERESFLISDMRVDGASGNWRLHYGSPGSASVSADSVQLTGASISPTVPTEFGEIDRAGWPFRALESINHDRARITAPRLTISFSSSRQGIDHGLVIDGVPGSLTSDWRALPLKPIWTGLVLNVLIFGALWFGMMVAVRAGVRRSRRRAGCCAECGYDLRGNTGQRCPECGTESPVGASR